MSFNKRYNRYITLKWRLTMSKDLNQENYLEMVEFMEKVENKAYEIFKEEYRLLNKREFEGYAELTQISEEWITFYLKDENEDFYDWHENRHHVRVSDLFNPNHREEYIESLKRIHGDDSDDE